MIVIITIIIIRVSNSVVYINTYIDRHYLSVEVRNVFSFNEISSLQIPKFSQRRLDSNSLKICCVICFNYYDLWASLMVNFLLALFYLFYILCSRVMFWCILIIAHTLLSSVKIGFTKKCFDFILRDDDDANLKNGKKIHNFIINW